MGENEEKSLALELLQEVKIQSKRWMWAFFAILIAWVLTIAGFMWYLSLYDFSSTIDQTGLYTYIDSDGNVITSDMTSEEMKSILEVIQNGTSNSDKK